MKFNKLGQQSAKTIKNPNILWAVIVLLLAIQFIPQVADFWADHFVDPIMADSKAKQALNTIFTTQ